MTDAERADPDTRWRIEATAALSGPAEAAAFYDDWSAGYDADMAALGYTGPDRVAAALAEHAEDRAAPVLDLGCGTGLAAAHLRRAGFGAIDGIDLSPGMLVIARASGAYRALTLGDVGDVEAFAEGYGNAVLVGSLNPAHIPPTALDRVLAALPSGGCLAFTLTEASAADRAVEARLAGLIDGGAAELLVKDFGPHMPGAEIDSTLYLLRKRDR